ncbi:MAG: hypothetical protein ACM34K_14245 [Bacillota bacterium]
MKPKFINWKHLLIIIFTLPFIIGTSPKPALHQFILRGHIDRPGNREKQDFIITLAVKFSYDQNRQVVELTSGTGAQPGNYNQSVTDSSGMFYLDVTATRPVDSIAVKVKAVDRTDYISHFFSVDEAVKTEVRSKWQSGNASGCMGCGTEPEYTDYISAYQYHFPEMTVNVPY